MKYEQITMFDGENKFINDKPIRLIELFAGYGSQSLALKYLGLPFEHYKISEWAVKSIQAYKDIHFTNDNIDYSRDMSVSQIKDWLLGRISSDYNSPMTEQQINRLAEQKARIIYNNMQATHNLGSITKITADDLNITDTDKFTYLMTYSFPCVTADSLILTKDGYKAISEVQVGEYVLTKSNTWQKVAKKFSNGKHKTCYVQAMCFENIHCTLNHKFYVRERYHKGHKCIRCFREPIFKEVKDITKNDFFGVPVIQEEISFYTKELDFWYMVGYYLGDGWLSVSGNEICLACNDTKLAKLKVHLLQAKWKWTYSYSTSCFRLRFCNKEIREFIEKYIGTGCEEKRICGEILTLPKEQLQALFNGYLDSDGCIIDGKMQFSTINRQMAYGISAIINKLYHRPVSFNKTKVKPKKMIQGREVNQKDWYLLRFNPNNNKQDKAFYENGYIWYPFNKIEMAEEEPVFNMEIENDHSYIIQSCISKNCQDLSLAGQQKGMSKGNGTRSGLLWEVERLLGEMKELPQILLMENVPQVHGTKNKQDFNNWCNFLESLGYKNYWQDINAKDYGIPQNRNRCFMVSLIDDYNYSFPPKMELQVRLKDFLDKQVDEKYYLSKTMVEYISQGNDKWTGNNDKSIINRDIAVTINTRVGNVRCDSSDYICDSLPQNFDLKNLNIKQSVICNLYEMGIKGFNRDTGEILSPNGICKTIQTMQGGNRQPKVIELGYIPYPNSDKKHQSNIVISSQGICSTIDTCTGGNRQPKILETQLKTKNKRLISMLDKIDVSKTQAIDMYNQCVHNDTIQTISTRVDASNCTAVTQDYRIRKLTERECFRLMGVKEQDFEKASKNQSMSSLYHLAGDSIVTTCLMAIFGELFEIDYNKKINELVKELKNE